MSTEHRESGRSWERWIAALLLFGFLFLIPLPSTPFLGGIPWSSPVDVLLLAALGLGFALGDRRRLFRVVPARRAIVLMAALCVVKCATGWASLEHGLLATYSGPGGKPAVARSIEYRRLDAATRIDARLEFEDETPSLGRRPFPLWFFDSGFRDGLGLVRIPKGVPLATPRARERYRPSPRARPEFTALWRGLLRPPRSGRYVVRVEGGGEVRLMVGDTKPGMATPEFTGELAAGELVPIDVRQHHPAGAPLFLRLAWTPPAGREQTVPSSALYPRRTSRSQVRLDRLASPLRAIIVVTGLGMAIAAAALLLLSRRLPPQRRWFLGIVGFVFGLRLILHIAYFALPHTSIMAGAIGDDYRYLGFASDIIHLDPLSPTSRAYYFAPAYRYFLVVVQLLFGEGLPTIALIQRLLGALTCGIVYSIGRRAFSDRAGVLAAGLTAFSPLLTYYESRACIATFACFFAVLSIYLAMLARSSRSLWKLFAAGIVLGITVLARPNLLLFALPTVVWIALAERGWIAGLRRAAVLSAGILVLVAPCALKNFAASGRFVLLTTSGPVNLFIGNNPRATGTYMLPYPDSDGEDGHVQRALKFVKDQPRQWLHLLGKKISLVLRVKALWIPYAGALIGWILARARRRSQTLPITAGILGVLATPLIFFLFKRLLIPGVLMLMLYFGFALDSLLQLLRTRRLSPHMTKLVCAAGLLALSPVYLYLAVYCLAVLNRVQTPWNLESVASVTRYLLMIR